MLLAAAATMQAAGPENVLVVVNTNSPLSRSIAEYYTRRRSIPATNACSIAASVDETVSRAAFDSTIAAPVGACLTSRRLTEAILYIVTTQGVPLRIEGTIGLSGTAAAVAVATAAAACRQHAGREDRHRMTKSHTRLLELERDSASGAQGEL